MGLDRIVFRRRAGAAGCRQINPVDELHQQVAERSVERTGMTRVHLGDGKAAVLKQFELMGLVGIGSIRPGAA